MKWFSSFKTLGWSYQFNRQRETNQKLLFNCLFYPQENTKQPVCVPWNWSPLNHPKLIPNWFFSISGLFLFQNVWNNLCNIFIVDGVFVMCCLRVTLTAFFVCEGTTKVLFLLTVIEIFCYKCLIPQKLQSSILSPN